MPFIAIVVLALETGTLMIYYFYGIRWDVITDPCPPRVVYLNTRGFTYIYWDIDKYSLLRDWVGCNYSSMPFTVV